MHCITMIGDVVKGCVGEEEVYCRVEGTRGSI